MKNQIFNNSIYDTTIRLLIMLLIIVWCLLILYPFTSVLLWSLIFAMALYPLHTKIAKKLGGKPKLASALIVILALAIIFIPSWFLIDKLVSEVQSAKIELTTNGFTLPAPKENVREWPVVGEQVYEFWKGASENLGQTADKYHDQLADKGKKLAKGVLGALSALIQILISFIIAAVLLVFGEAGEGIRKFFRKLAGSRGDEFADITMMTVSSVLKGVLGVALVVSFLHGIFFMLAGVPYAGILTLGIFVLGVLQIPAIILTLPIILYLFAVKSTSMAIMWTVFLIVAGLSDNILKPLLLGKGAAVPMLVIFLGVIGGFIFSGFIGLFTGAIVMSLGYKLFMGWLNTNEEATEL
ncbi:AI-2E family transporter [Lutimonas halocynthiae]|uniref:AI-2E family transporter n=1 Tax=Lutimonas halocynthiae TaxID=1446477 RepID=UPI0025B3D0A1|nr:AI-2E family transporter [Lutimonas halocynthiae]MDN3641920.1 AI-2E family transporter [Lutimonas halocynthiae]